ncbi:hypothetical protein ASF11_22890 [Acidovorax sp. Leaf76]|jgi:hypothetical protein|uniref:DUF6776 family protein n=1 Tax=unclassified Acidovorax TaxID=2684926 RepID=UPI0006F487EC|nr:MULTISPECIES: DUF6776 family protein [unclassified Acidovorax]KQO23837.1 hypothetical protein ASF11_22890 [Acidovorax sp. Leaf76]KQO35626.1 hypothetical protein ASF19_22960 [Acidovorax sp. Leaf84]KQS39868.1 hypothetical protein ASG27_22190 [Acidovorax sp. Leaf191]
MRLRLLRRRLTISAPRVAIRSALPWPFRWLALAVVLGLCAAVALWAFEFGKSIAGLDSISRDELNKMRAELTRLRDAGQEQQTVAHTADSLLIAERAAKENLMAQVRQLEADNRTLREDLGFFEKLIPAAKTEGLAIRSLQAEVLGGMQLRWQVLVIQAARNAPDFNGRLELVLAGTQDGKPWTQTQPAQGQPVQVKQYRRIEGVLDLPPNAVVKTVTARVLEGSTVRAVQAMTIE